MTEGNTKGMKWLVLGGTKFVGRAFVEEALAAGHEVTLFNRGKTAPDAFPDVEKIVGDRTKPEDLEMLKGRRWDAVFDPSGYLPRIVKMSADLLKDAADYYVFVSSISVYADFKRPKIDESYPTGTIEDATTEEITGESYGPLKVLCEEVVQAAFPGKSLIVRAGLIVGPHDPTDRFTYWPVKVERGVEFVAPEGPDFQMQIIDARDIAKWVLEMAEQGKDGVYNVTGDPVSISDFFATTQKVTGRRGTPVYMDAAFLAEQEVQPWQHLPLWIPASDEAFAYMRDVSVDKAKAEGLIYRPLEDTVRDLLEWHHTRVIREPSGFGLPPEKESALLELWRAREQAE